MASGNMLAQKPMSFVELGVGRGLGSAGLAGKGARIDGYVTFDGLLTGINWLCVGLYRKPVVSNAGWY